MNEEAQRFKEAILNARRAFDRLPKRKQDELNRGFDTAAEQARFHTEYRRCG